MYYGLITYKTNNVYIYIYFMGFLSGSVVKNPPGLGRSLSWEDPLEKGMSIYLVFLPRKPPGQRSLTVYSPWSCK